MLAVIAGGGSELRLIQKCYDIFQKLYTTPRRKRAKVQRVLLFCDTVAMEEHIIDYYEGVKGLAEGKELSFYLFYDKQSVTPTEVTQGGARIMSGRNITRVKGYLRLILIPWNLVVCADLMLPCYIHNRYVPTLYVNHGLHMVSNDRGENLYAYGRTCKDERGEYSFSAMLEPNRQYAQHISRQNPELGKRIVPVGFKYAHRIRQGLELRMQYRQQLGIRPQEVFVAVFGTWGKDSLFHRGGTSLIAQAGKLMGQDYRFALSIHPREYHPYDSSIQPLGPYIDSLAEQGFLIRPPRCDWLPYLIAADVIVSDYSSMYEYALLAVKPLVFADFPDDCLWKHATGNRLKSQIPVFSGKEELKAVLIQAQQGNYQSFYQPYIADIDTTREAYECALCDVTQKLLLQSCE